MERKGSKVVDSSLYTFGESASMYEGWNPVICAYFTRQLSYSATLWPVVANFTAPINKEIVTNA
jgi:hypothetical protein